MKLLNKIGGIGIVKNYTKNPMAKDVRQPKYRPQVIPDKKKPVLTRKKKHKGDSYEGQKN